MVNKLARPDRGVIDEQDVKSVLVRLQKNIDWKYLEKKAGKAGVFSIIKSINEV
jgi:hypothetical protein